MNNNPKIDIDKNCGVTRTPEKSPTPTRTTTRTPKVTRTATKSLTPTRTVTRSITPTRTATKSSTPIRTSTTGLTRTPTNTITKTSEITRTPTATPNQTPTPTITSTITRTPTPTPTKKSQLGGGSVFPAAPSNLIALEGNEAIDLSWSAPTNPRGDAFYLVAYRPTSATNWQYIVTSVDSIRRVVIAGLTNDTEYEIKVGTANGNTAGDIASAVWSLSIFATPIAQNSQSTPGIISNNSIIAGTFSEGLLISNDDGSNWKTIARIGVPTNPSETLLIKSIGSNQISSVAFADNTIYVGTNKFTVMPGGLSISRDFGSTWQNTTLINNITSDIINDVYALNSIVLVGMPGGIALSNDNGSTWITTSQISSAIGFYGGLQSSNISKVYMAKKDNNIAAFVAYGDLPSISRSIRSIGNDGSFFPGAWTNFFPGGETNANWNDPIINSIFVDPLTNKLYIATNRGLSIANDAFATNLSFTNYLFGSENPLLAPNGNWIVDKPGGAQLPLGGNPWGVKDVFAIGQKIYIATYGTGLKFSNNGGSTWSTISTETNYLWKVSVVDNKIYVIGDLTAGLLMSKDNGNSWSKFYSNSALSDLILINT
jgi:hypothetical protein